MSQNGRQRNSWRIIKALIHDKNLLQAIGINRAACRSSEESANGGLTNSCSDKVVDGENPEQFRWPLIRKSFKQLQIDHSLAFKSSRHETKQP